MDTKTTTTICQPVRRQPSSFLTRWSLQSLIMLALIASVSFGTVGCKAKKEARARQEAMNARIAEAKQVLLAIINDKTMPVEEKESELARIKDMNLQDPEILDLIDRAEAAIAEQKAAAKAEAAAKPTASEDSFTQLSNLFQEVARSGTDAANAKIQEALSLFSSTETPVLIIISQSGGKKDYDEPTTIRKYLDYLKDTKSRPAQVNNLEYDANGKIKEVELIKKY